MLWGKVSPLAFFQLRSEKKVRASLKRYLARAQPTDSDEERGALEEYLYQILLRPTSAQIALF